MGCADEVLVNGNGENDAIPHLQHLTLLQLHIIEMEEEVARCQHAANRADTTIVLVHPLDTSGNVSLRKRGGVVVVVVHEFLRTLAALQHVGFAIRLEFDRLAEEGRGRAGAGSHFAGSIENHRGSRARGKAMVVVVRVITRVKRHGSRRTGTVADVDHLVLEARHFVRRLLSQRPDFVNTIDSLLNFRFRRFLRLRFATNHRYALAPHSTPSFS